MNARLALAALPLALAACSVPGVGYVGNGPLPFEAIAVTRVDAGTGNALYGVNLKWTKMLQASNYEVLRSINGGEYAQLNSSGNETYTDGTLTANQTAKYKIRAVDGAAKEVNVSAEKTVTVLAQQVGKPALQEPAAQASLGVSELPTFKWAAVDGASWYYVRVRRVSDDVTVYSALTKETSIQFATKSPVSLDRFSTVFPTGNDAGIQKGVVHSWTVEAVRADNADPAVATGVDLNTSAALTFSQGQ